MDKQSQSRRSFLKALVSRPVSVYRNRLAKQPASAEAPEPVTETEDDRVATGGGLQFSLRTLLLLTTAFCCWLVLLRFHLQLGLYSGCILGAMLLEMLFDKLRESQHRRLGWKISTPRQTFWRSLGGCLFGVFLFFLGAIIGLLLV
ncbi:hypothetical protein [Lignipirellula cremea]|uniref:Uncharacterized protein n=1 Tax=Lignipirellula cremea TaxID=2528010 RepID=A0A518DLF3_9BACT|nr:hypothetical protein [Lignipirellula cremea]QDU92673.1 hypothetical protein Pla8534_04210 [Lignipirellula cremea]